MTDAHPSPAGSDPASPPPIEEFAALSPPDLIARYAAGVHRLDPRVLELNDEEMDTFFRPGAHVGRWSCRILLGHLADAEVVQVHRMRRTVGEVNPVLALWDEESFIDEDVYAPSERTPLPGAACVAVIHTLRLWCVEWLRALSEDAWSRRALHPEAGEQTLQDQLAKSAWHLEHHAWYLGRKLQRFRPGGPD